MQTTLFEPLKIGSFVEARNRVFVAPMCQYSVEKEDGIATDWHFQHYGALGAGGFGMVVVEATGVEPRGRISPRDLGLWNDEQVAPLRRIVDFIHSQGALAAVQLGHAGGKGSTYPSLPGFSDGSVPADEGGWQTVSAMSGSVMPNYAPAQACTQEDIATIIAAFAAAALRADRAGFDTVQVHGAHGYLLHQFLSPLTNERTDQYGGDEEGRTLLLKEVMRAVRSALPENKPLGLRISATDWVQGGWDVAASERLVTALQAENLVDWVDVSTGGLGRGGKINVGPAYQTECAASIRRALRNDQTVVSAVGLITNAAQGDTIVRTGLADAVSIGRPALRNPHWAVQAAADLNISKDKLPVPAPYHRARW